MKTDKVYLCDFGSSHSLDGIKGTHVEILLGLLRCRCKWNWTLPVTRLTCASNMYALGLLFLYVSFTHEDL